ncbi:hypothetical protein PIB30_062067 [Stylosanthes scabra]|uniref:Uncharacterized protein n=1 Tax=Stylosanthes scabra TaxID=79078 RepID=A0ABU6UKI5_9FABA|nr:hypothetical protein [Stylosanthes scabra]
MSSSTDGDVKNKGGRSMNPEDPKPKSLDSRCSPSDITKLMTQIGENNVRMGEVEATRFGSFRHILEWIVHQELYIGFEIRLRQ